MDQVVYMLGAGFSAPLGLPLMTNFLSKSKDLYIRHQSFKHFSEVFDRVEKMHVSKTFFNSDLLNIEEILSILEIDETVGSNKFRDRFSRYVCDVIAAYTPRLDPIQVRNVSDWPNQILWRLHPWGPYLAFVCGLQNLRGELLARPADTTLTISSNIEAKCKYSVVTTNYDMVLESALDAIDQVSQPVDALGFVRPGQNASDLPQYAASLAKLHGSVDSQKIVPPTWSKLITSEIAREWKLAHESVKRANHIRIIGYSLPSADSYFKYLLKSAVSECDNLKSLDVICLDIDGSARERYSEFVAFRDYRFFDAKTEAYLAAVVSRIARQEAHGTTGSRYAFSGLEDGHSAFCETYSSSTVRNS